VLRLLDRIDASGALPDQRLRPERFECVLDGRVIDIDRLAALEATASRRKVGDPLELRDGLGTVRVRLEAL
jgi:hypothetical protein